MLNEETMHARVEDAKGHSQNCYTMHGNSSMAADPPQGINRQWRENSQGNWPLAAKDLRKKKKDK